MRGIVRRGFGILFLVSCNLLGCNDASLIGNGGNGNGGDAGNPPGSDGAVDSDTTPDDGTQASSRVTEEFTVNTANVDILWIVDDSNSMGNQQRALARNFSRFIQSFYDLALDFHMAVTTTSVDCVGCENGRFVGSPSVLTTALSRADLAAEFTTAVDVGTEGSQDEKGLRAAEVALSAPLLAGANAGFLRDDALLAILFVSDENDHHFETSPQEFVDIFRAVKGGRADKLLLGGITAPRNRTCDGARERGERYVDTVRLVDGPWEDICSPDLGVPLTRLGEVVSSSVNRVYKLREMPVADSIKVSINGADLATGLTTWAYVDSIHAVMIAPTRALVAGDEIVVTYDIVP